MMSRRYQQCSRCVMDTTDQEITFNGVVHCCHCTEFLCKRAKHLNNGRESANSLERIVEEIKRHGKGKEYDCIIGISGGADSSYVAYLAKQKGLRPLVVHMDNGWDSEKA